MATFDLLTLALILAVPLASAHSWVEQFSLIGANGTYTSTYGYPRNYVARTDPGFASLDYLVPQLSTGRARINASDLLCHPSQRVATQAPAYPRLTVAPGSAVAMKYLENGHVTLPQNQAGKPPSSGPVFVFGTLSPHPDEKLADVLAWTADGKGGDTRGRLLGANNFDDGRCHQLNSGAISLARKQQFPNPISSQPGTNVEQWCETDIVLPAAGSPLMQPGKPLTIYWVWAWTTAPGVDPGLPTGKDEYYTTCSDFDVVAGPLADAPVKGTLVQQDPQTAAVSDWASRTAITSTPSPPAATATTAASSSSLHVPAQVLSTSPTSASSPTALIVLPISQTTTSATTYTLATTTSTPTTPVPATSTTATSTSTIPTDATATTLTVLVTVTAVLAPTQSMLVVRGTHVVTFSQDLGPATAIASAIRNATATAAARRDASLAREARFVG